MGGSQLVRQRAARGSSGLAAGTPRRCELAWIDPFRGSGRRAWPGGQVGDVRRRGRPTADGRGGCASRRGRAILRPIRGSRPRIPRITGDGQEIPGSAVGADGRAPSQELNLPKAALAEAAGQFPPRRSSDPQQQAQRPAQEASVNRVDPQLAHGGRVIPAHRVSPRLPRASLPVVIDMIRGSSGPEPRPLQPDACRTEQVDSAPKVAGSSPVGHPTSPANDPRSGAERYGAAPGLLQALPPGPSPG